MGAKVIPQPGEFFEGFPHALRVARLRIGKTTVAATNSAFDIQLSTTTTNGKVKLFTVPAGCLVHDIQFITLGSMVVTAVGKFGDTNSASGWGNSSIIKAKGTYSASVSVAGANKGGKFYSAAQDINLTLTTKVKNTMNLEIHLVYEMANKDPL